MTLLARQSVGSVMPDNVINTKLSSKCPLCHGRKMVNGKICPRCHGTGRQHDPEGQNQTRSVALDRLTAADVSLIAGGLDDHKWQAIRWRELHDEDAGVRVRDYLYDFTYRLAKDQGWQYNENMKWPRLEQLTYLACMELAFPRSPKFATDDGRAAVMHLSRAAFRKSWFMRYCEVQGQLQWWACDADEYLYRQFGGG